MMRLVSVDIQEGERFYHFEDREKKIERDVSEKTIIAKSVQCGNSFFVDALLGMPFEEKRE